jgi:hypothetical protein
MTAKARTAAKKQGASGQQKTAGRARARSKSRAKSELTKQARVRTIIEMMAGGLWVSGSSSYELADRWKLAAKTVETDAAEASRTLRAKVMEEPELADRAARLVSMLETRMASCVVAGNDRDLSKLAALYADVTGLKAPQKLEVGGNLGELLQLALSDGSGTPPHPEVGTEPEPIRR